MSGIKLNKRPDINKKMEEIRKGIKPEIMEYLLAHKRLREQLTENWSPENKPNFAPKITYSGSKTSVKLEMIADDAPGASVSVYRMLSGPVDKPGDAGTSIRHAVMDENYHPQTRAGSRSSSPKGRNRRVIVSKKIRLPGHEYRRFDETFQEQLKDFLKNKLNTGLQKGISRANQ